MDGLDMWSNRIDLIGEPNLSLSLVQKALAQQCHAEVSIVPNISLVQSQAKPQVLLVDVQKLEEEELVHVLYKLQQIAPRACVALIQVSRDYSVSCLASFPNLRGVFSDKVGIEDLIKGVHAIMNGEYWLPRRWMNAYLDQSRKGFKGLVHARLVAGLTSKEQVVLEHLVEGKSNAEIAACLHISQHTVKTHLHHLFKKLGVDSRVHAVRWAINLSDMERSA